MTSLQQFTLAHVITCSSPPTTIGSNILHYCWGLETYPATDSWAEEVRAFWRAILNNPGNHLQTLEQIQQDAQDFLETCK